MTGGSFGGKILGGWSIYITVSARPAVPPPPPVRGVETIHNLGFRFRFPQNGTQVGEMSHEQAMCNPSWSLVLVLLGLGMRWS
jgi:hypothetical protein